MRYGINVGFGEPMLHEVAGLAERGFTDTRQDVMWLSAPVLATRMRESRIGTLCPLWIMAGGQLASAWPCERVELLNEPNLNGVSPTAYAEAWNRHGAPAQARGVHVFAGSLSNLDRPTLAWFEAAWAGMLEKPQRVSCHRYPEVTGGSRRPHPGFRNRTEEVEALRQIIGGVPLAVTEFGYHTAARKRWGWWPLRAYTDLEVAQYVREDWQFWAAQGAESAYVYQLNDGPSARPVDRYGIRTVTGVWKPAARSLA